MTTIYHAHLYGKQGHKYDWLKNHDVLSTDWHAIQSQTPFYLLIPQDTDLLSEYQKGWKITDLMPKNSMGITTGKDDLFVAFDPQFLNKSFEECEKIISVNYRPFDERFLFYDSNLLERSRNEFMSHIIFHENIAMATIRRSRKQNIGNFFVCSKAVDKCILSSLDNAQIIPLYVYNNSITQERRANFSSEFLQDLSTKLDYTPPAESIFFYIYAVFHSPTYRNRYAEFLKLDFPRVPLTRNANLFRTLATFGEALVNLHLMKSSVLEQWVAQFEGEGDRTVAPGHPKYKKSKVIINKQGDGFTGVPEDVWNFYIGGYQVCHKWLKDRKGCTLSEENILHYQRIVAALKETIALMQKIDEAIPSWPIE